MNKYPRWKYLLIIFVIALGVIYALPNLFGEDPAIQISAHAGYQVNQATISTLKKTLISNSVPSTPPTLISLYFD